LDKFGANLTSILQVLMEQHVIDTKAGKQLS
jgi:hypothetical protein